MFESVIMAVIMKKRGINYIGLDDVVGCSPSSPSSE